MQVPPDPATGATQPALDDSSELRPYILRIANGEGVLREGVATTALSEGDEVEVHQAIPGR